MNLINLIKAKDSLAGNQNKRETQGEKRGASKRILVHFVTHVLGGSRNSCVFRVISSLLFATRSSSALFRSFFFCFCFCRKQAVPFENPRFRVFLFDYRSCLQLVSKYPSLQILP